MPRERILIVDDEERIREMIREYLNLDGYRIEEASNGVEALSLFAQNEYSLVVLDVMMPNMNGWSVCREIRKTSHVPIIMLTAMGEEYDKLFGFDLGVDDYMVKPFSPKELLARIKAVTKRSRRQVVDDGPENKAVFEGLVIEYDSHNVYVNEKPVSLTPKEYELLTFFARNPNKVYSRDRILTEVWGYEFTGDARTVDTHVKMLRERLAEYRSFITTVWGTGYKFEVRGSR